MLSFIWKNKKLRIVKAILNNKRISGGITIPDLKLYYKAILIKLYSIGTETEILMSGINWRPRNKSHTYGHEFWQRSQNHTMEKECIFNKWCWSNWMSACRRMKIDPCLSSCTKLKSKWMKDFNIKEDMLNLIEEKVGNTLECFCTADNFLNKTPWLRL